jgi:hypothetical protein
MDSLLNYLFLRKRNYIKQPKKIQFLKLFLLLVFGTSYAYAFCAAIDEIHDSSLSETNIVLVSANLSKI